MLVGLVHGGFGADEARGGGLLTRRTPGLISASCNEASKSGETLRNAAVD